MDTKDLKLQCLRLAVEFGSARTAASPEELAERYYRFVTGRLNPAQAADKPGKGK